jgi:8-oxo-dGTP diphosphatase
MPQKSAGLKNEHRTSNITEFWMFYQKFRDNRAKTMKKTSRNQRPMVGVAVIVIKDGKVLLGKRISAHGSGTWQFPGGHLEFGESIEDCARREVMEETGLRIRRIRIGPYTNDYFEAEGKHYITLYMLADYDAGDVILNEPHKCERWEWVTWPPPIGKPLFLPIRNLLQQSFELPATSR